jgi:hypothetical protein
MMEGGLHTFFSIIAQLGWSEDGQGSSTRTRLWQSSMLKLQTSVLTGDPMEKQHTGWFPAKKKLESGVCQ